MRLFLAYTLSDPLTHYALTLQDALKPSFFSGRLTSPMQLHLTVLFLGEQPGHRLAELEDVLSEVIEHTPCTEASTGTIGAFKQGAKSLLYLGLNTGDAPIVKLHKRLKKVLIDRHFVLPQQAFTPHITLARQVVFHEAKPPSLIPQRSLTFTLEALTLFHSYRHHETLVHEPLATFNLAPSHTEG